MIKARYILPIIAAGVILRVCGNGFAQPLTGKCGDGICDDFEKAHSNLCPQDCAPGKSTESSGSQWSPAAPIGRCGDAACDNFEKANPNACPEDCGGENTEVIESKGLYQCPQYAPPAPSFYENCRKQGGTVTPGRKDDKGCQSPPQCVLPGKSTESSGSQGSPAAPIGKCGDNVCDNFEKANPFACPKDCLSAGETPVAAEEPENISLENEDSPFGFHPAIPFGMAKDMGAQWTRGAEAPYIFWDLVDPKMKGIAENFQWKSFAKRPDGGEVFTDFDNLFSAKRAGLYTLHNIDIQGAASGRSYFKSGSWLPANEEAYRAFVKEAVKRYSFIKYWQVGNEPNLKVAALGYAGFQRITYEAIKEANPDARVLIAGLAGNMDMESINDTSYESILKDLGGKYIDIFDIHFYGDAKGGSLKFKGPNGGETRLLGYRDFKAVYEYYRGILDKNGFSDVPIWITEMSTPSGTSYFGPITLVQTEAEQAGDMLKRYVYPLFLGVKKIFWAFSVMEGFGEWDDDYFDHTGLVYGNRDGVHRAGEKKFGYYAYKLMAEKLEGSDWAKTEAVKEDAANHIYAYRFIKGDEKILVAWWDYFADGSYPEEKKKQLVLNGIDAAQLRITEAVPGFSSGSEIKEGDYKESFAKDTVTVDNGKAQIWLGENPVYIEE